MSTSILTQVGTTVVQSTATTHPLAADDYTASNSIAGSRDAFLKHLRETGYGVL